MLLSALVSDDRRLKDNVEVEVGATVETRCTPDGTCSLVFSKARMEDAGNYTCLVQNALGSDRTECKVVVKGKDRPVEVPEAGEPPDFIKRLRETTVADGDDLNLEVRVIGKPMPEVTWSVSYCYLAFPEI